MHDYTITTTGGFFTREAVLDLISQARRGLEQSNKQRVTRFAQHHHNRWWRRLLRHMGLKTPTYEEWEREGQNWLRITPYTIYAPSEFATGVGWDQTLIHLCDDLESICNLGNGDIFIKADDLRELRKYAAQAEDFA